MSKKSVVESAIILTVAGIITRVLGFVYRIYLSNIIGAEGMGLYQLIMPVYSLAWSIACSGFTTTISKLTAEEKAKGEHGNIYRILKLCVLISTSIAVVLSYILYFFASFIAVTFFKDDRVVLALRVLSLSFPFMAAGSCMRGYFFGMRESVVPAVNQVLEQIVRMSVIFFLASYFIPYGLTYACTVCVIGIVAEEAFSLLYIFIAYRNNKTKNKFTKKPSLSLRKTLLTVFAMALPLAGNRISGSLLATLENVMMPQRLAMFTSSKTNAMVAFGQLSGMAMPLVYFPSAFLTSLSVSLIPVISEAAITKNYKKINRAVSKTILFSSVIGIGAASLFVVFADELGLVIYNQDIGSYLTILGLMCPFLYIQMAISGILNGLGHQVFVFRNSLLSSVITILFIYFLVPIKGVNGFLAGWFISLIITCILDLNMLYKSVKLNIDLVNWFAKPLVSGLAASLVMRLAAKKYLYGIFGDLTGLITAIVLICVFYAAFVIATGCVSADDIRIIFPRKSILPNRKHRGV